MAARNRNDLASLQGRLEETARLAERDVRQAVSDVVSSVAGELARNTPIDTGLARSNWITSIGSPWLQVMFPYRAYPSRYRRGPRGGIQKGGRFGERINTNSVIEQARVAVLGWKPGDKIYITNNTDHIEALNDGKSPQAPAGFVPKAVTVGVAKALKGFRFRNTRAGK